MNEHLCLFGFRPVRSRAFAELEGTLREYVHEKTGARLCWLDRPDENKAFSIAFKTLPEDSTGVFHILEHSVLCGSDKYPVREPFVELLKSSVQTFLNAMTFPDKTVYPVSSRNDRDFLNLMDVYLDAVFHPAIYRRPEIFRQEGWRFEGEGDALCLQGVVLNEMKGAFASPERVRELELSPMLAPDTCYRWCSGGDPAHIPELSYEQFIANHRKYYHPSNAWISLVGSVDLEACLEKLDGFLRCFERQDCAFDIPMQAPVPAQRRTVPYSIGAGEPAERRAAVTCGVQVAAYDDSLRSKAFTVLCDYLADDDDAPLKRAVLDADLAEDFEMGLLDGIQQSFGYWTAWNTDAAQQPALERTVRETLTRLVEQGLDRERLDACFRSYAFELRDRDGGHAPRSLTEAVGMLDAWLYGGDPAQPLLAEDALSELEAALATDYPERLLRELFLDDAHTALLTMIPSQTLSAERAAQEQARVRAAAAGWTEADRARLAEQAEALRRFQQTPDSEAALATIPMLRLSDLAPAPAPLPVTESAPDGVPALRHDTGGSLCFLRAHFDASDLAPEELPVLKLLSELLGCMATRRFSRARLPLEIKRTLGRLDFKPTVIELAEPARCRVLLSAVSACLPDQTEQAADLLAEMLTATVWDDLPLLRDNLRQLELEERKRLSAAGHRFALTRAAASLTAWGAARDRMAGIEYLRWLTAMCAADDAALRGLLGQMDALLRRLVCRERMRLSCSANVPDEALRRLTGAVPASGLPAPDAMRLALAGARREGVPIPAAVGFAAMAYHLHGCGAYTGSWPVLAGVLNYTFLWNEIRVQGGAYGAGFGARAAGDLFCYTYRDPQPARSLDVFRRAAEWVRAFCADAPDLTCFILGAVSQLDPLRSAEAKLDAAEYRRFRGVTEDDLRRWYGELLHTTAADLLELVPALEALAAENAVCITAGQPILDACGGGLEELLRLS